MSRSTSQIPKSPLYYLPMLFTYIFHIHSHNSHCMCNIWSCENHHIHQDANCWWIRDPVHVFYLLLCLRTHLLSWFEMAVQRCTNWFCILHSKPIQHLLYVLTLRQCQIVIFPISCYSHTKDFLCNTQINVSTFPHIIDKSRI